MSDSTFFSTVRLMVILVLVSFLSNCTSRVSVQQPVANVEPVKPNTATSGSSARELVEQATTEAPEVAVNTLIKASEAYIAEQNYSRALWLALQVTALSTDASSLYKIKLIQAESLYLLQQMDLAEQQLTAAKALLGSADIAQPNIAQPNIAQLSHYYQLLAKVQQARGLPVAAAEAQLYAVDLDENSDTGNTPDYQALWQQLTLLSDWQVKQLVKRAPPHSKGWQQLLFFAHKFGDQQQTFNRYLRQWQRSFPSHPAQNVVIALQNQLDDELVMIDNVAVILPLSGKQSMAGKSAQQGILAAFNNDPQITLHFIDSSQLDMTRLPETLTSLAIDRVIGPLLKPKVSEYVKQTDLQLPTILLNIPVNEQVPDHCVALSMLPEDEAVQAASILSNRNYQQPIVFSHQDQVSQRMASAFLAQWQKITNQTPEIFYFDRQEDIQQQLKRSLDVNFSENRIKDLQIRVEPSLETETRNRRDLDMVYLIGNSRETRLLKPYIDVNTSPFADPIPIFASSRSHSDMSTQRDSRDLAGLAFTEIPWLLASDQQNKALKQLNKQLWPQKSDSLQRIFAMGYDSFSLLGKINKMRRHAYIRHYGQTGILQLTADNTLTRSLIWGTYQEDKVIPFAVE